MIDLLVHKTADALEISSALGIREKAVYEHLVHVARSVAPRKQRLVIVPATCLNCGHVFSSRRRMKRPGRCHRCKSERVAVPKYRIIAA